MSIDLKDLLDFCQAEAIANRVSPTEESIYREICRTYSKLFHTPLHLVLEMPADQVILNVYEDRLEEADLEKFETLESMMDQIMSIEDPNYEAAKESKLEEDIAKYEREEEERVAAGRAIHPSLKRDTPQPKKTLPENEVKKEEKKPTGGSVDFSSMDQDEES